MATEPTPEDITQELYKRNVELAIKNKTLSLLSKLYEISILTLEPLELGERITQIIQAELDFDLVGIFRYDDLIDELSTLHFAKSKRLEEMLGDDVKTFDEVKISEVSRHVLFKPIFSGARTQYTDDLTQVWSNLPQDKLDGVRKNAHLRTIFLYPLAIGNRKILGVLIVGLNRAYDNLGEFEKESIRSFVNVIATALDKALLYQELQITNAKLARANSELNAANEELKKLDVAKSEFISIASHQLRAPLTVIRGYVSLALEGTLGAITQDTKESLEKVVFSANQLTKLITNLLDLSRMEAGKMRYNFAPTDFAPIVTRVVDEFQVRAHEKNLSLRLENRIETAPSAHLDPDKIREVIINLIDNAINYSTEGEILLTLEISKPQLIRLTVKDHGMGIKREDISRLFTKFTRTEEARKANQNSTGIGLYFIKRVVEDHGGKLWVESEGIGKGSTFFVELPYQA